MTKLNKYSVKIPATADQPEKVIEFKTTKEACDFLGIQSYSILYNMSRGITKGKHAHNSKFADIEIRRINENITKNKLRKNINKDIQEEHKKEYINVLHSLVPLSTP